MASAEYHIMAAASDDDSISLTSTAGSEWQDEYEVETILTEREGQDGKPFFLVKWAGYDAERATWEGEESFTTQDMIDEWRDRLKRIDQGLEEPFDLDQWVLDVETKEEERQDRKRRRRAKRRRLGLPVTDNDEVEVQSPDDLDHDSEEDTDNDSMIEEILQKQDGALHVRRRRLMRGRRTAEESEDKNIGTAKQSTHPRRESSLQQRKHDLSQERLQRPTVPRRPSNSLSRPQIQRQTSNSSRVIPRPPTNRIVGRGPSRVDNSSSRYQPMLAKRVKGADIFKNWSIPKARKGRTAGPAGNFTTLQHARWAELRGRNEPAPDPNALKLFDPRSLKEKSAAYQSVRPITSTTASTKSPWEMIQDTLAIEQNKSADNGTAKNRKRVAFTDALSEEPLEISDDQSSHVSPIDRAALPGSGSSIASGLSQGKPEDDQYISTFEEESGVLPHSRSQPGVSDSTLHSSNRPRKSVSLKEYSEARRRASTEKQGDSSMDKDVEKMSASTAIPKTDFPTPQQTDNGLDAKHREFNPGAVFADFKKGEDCASIGAVELVGMSDGMRKWWLLTFGPKPELWFREICTADDFKSFIHEAGKSAYDAVDILPVGQAASLGLDSFEEMLSLTASGAVIFHENALIVAYPLQTMDNRWNFLGGGPKKLPEAKLRLYVRPPITSTIRDTGNMQSFSSSANETSRLVSVFSDILCVKYKDLLPTPPKKGEFVENFFLIFPASAAEEMHLTVEFLMSKPHNARVFTSTTAGAWDCFSSTVSQGVILIHPTFYRYQKIPRLVSMLRKNIKVWNLGTDDEETPPSFVFRPLFPYGAVIFLTDDLLQKQSSEANAIVQWFLKHSAKKAPGTWKLAARDKIVEFLLNELEQKGPKEGRLELWSAMDDLFIPFFVGLKFALFKDLDLPVLNLGEPEGESRKAKADFLAEVFAGTASMYAPEFRRFILVHPTIVEPWRERWQHLEIVTPAEFRETYMK